MQTRPDVLKEKTKLGNKKWKHQATKKGHFEVWAATVAAVTHQVDWSTICVGKCVSDLNVAVAQSLLLEKQYSPVKGET